jgi:Zn-finger nucleic acid-binding protein
LCHSQLLDRSIDRQVFDECDVDKSGKLDVGELDKLLKDLGITCNADELAQMVQDADDDDDGEIDPDEWNQIGELVTAYNPTFRASLSYARQWIPRRYTIYT